MLEFFKTNYKIILIICIISFTFGFFFPKFYKGVICTVDCSGHWAGYEYAKKKGYTNEKQCGGKSASFVIGCKSFVNSNDNDQ